MTTENLICIGVGLVIGAAGILVINHIRESLRRQRMSRLPRTILHRI